MPGQGGLLYCSNCRKNGEFLHRKMGRVRDHFVESLASTCDAFLSPFCMRASRNTVMHRNYLTSFPSRWHQHGPNQTLRLVPWSRRIRNINGPSGAWHFLSLQVTLIARSQLQTFFDRKITVNYGHITSSGPGPLPARRTTGLRLSGRTVCGPRSLQT
jgi:hypothetical protein